MFTGKGRLVAMISVIQAKKHSHALQEKGVGGWGVAHRDQTCSSETEPGWLGGAHSLLTSTGFHTFWRKAFPEDGVIPFPSLNSYICTMPMVYKVS